MCGIAGYYSHDHITQTPAKLFKAASLIAHRGPDDEGYALFNLDAQNNTLSLSGPDSYHTLQGRMPSISTNPVFPHHLAFAFRRLSIIDLSEKGHQPFWSEDRRLCLIFNGEVYNYVEIRSDLEKLGYTFKTSTDTEVLLAGYQAWGMDVLKQCNGPLAIALYDYNKNALFLARDRIGKNPLYFAVHQKTLYWASEIKPLLSMAGRTSFGINEQAVYDYLNFGWRDVNNQTFWEGINTLPAACWVSIDLTQSPTREAIYNNLNRYWDFPSERLTHKDISFSDAVERFRELFLDAVKIRGRADAKVAYSLSGGMDSSSIVATAANIIEKPFRTYSIQYAGLPCDEEPLARKVYERYPEKIDYHTYTPQHTDFWEICDYLVSQMEEPFHNPNIEPFQGYLRNARSDGYKVVLVGGGGDELLAGYNVYFYPMLMDFYRKHRLLSLLGTVFGDSNLIHRHSVRKRFRVLNDLMYHRRGCFDKYYHVSFFNPTGEEYAMEYFKDPAIVQRVQDRKSDVPLDFHDTTVGYLTDWLMNYWLRSGDHFQFGVSVETRRPFLDYRLVDFLLTLPPEFIVKRGWRKYILRKSMDCWLPDDVVWRRKKQGFPFNFKSWLSHAKPIVQGYLQSVSDNPYFDTDGFFRDYESLHKRNPSFLWRGISFCLWWRRIVENRSL